MTTETVIVDTDVASYFFKNSPDARPFREIVAGKRLALAFVSVAEVFKWALKRSWGLKRISDLENALHKYTILPYDRDLAWAWARVVAECESAGRPIATSDAWVAAAALRHDLALATNNIKHFDIAESRCGLKLLRPTT